MALDEKIDAIFERALFERGDFNEDSTSEIHTDYSGSPADKGYSLEEQKEIEMYTNDFENFLELRSDDNYVEKKRKQSRDSDENPAEKVFEEIFGKPSSEYKKS